MFAIRPGFSVTAIAVFVVGKRGEHVEDAGSPRGRTGSSGSAAPRAECAQPSPPPARTAFLPPESPARAKAPRDLSEIGVPAFSPINNNSEKWSAF